MDVLLGDELELERQSQEIERLDRFLEYQISGNAQQFLFNWQKHQSVRSEMHDFKFFRHDIDVQLDLKVSSSIVDVNKVTGRSVVGIDQTLHVQEIRPQHQEVIYQSPSNDAVPLMRRPVGGMVSGNIPVIS